MTGLYLHIPFCKSRCIYCDFFSTTRLDRREAYTAALCQELHDRRTDDTIRTIYIGGGTPSQLTTEQIAAIAGAISSNYDIAHDAEQTIEANPSDITLPYATHLRSLGFNRISLGIQTFDDTLLSLIGRRHDTTTALKAIETARQAGFGNISLDLIFGLPTQTFTQWDTDITIALQLRPQHISAYSLMYEEGTRLHTMLMNGEVEEADEELSLNMYQHLIGRLTDAGYHQYEISNFALPGYHSRHNSSYWDGTPYIGIGAGAHSYDGTTRRWNIADIDTYISTTSHHHTTHESETLTTTQRIDETIMTRLRTAEGLNLNTFGERFGNEAREYVMRQAQPFVESGKLYINQTTDTLRLTRQGIFTSNDIIATLFTP